MNIYAETKYDNRAEVQPKAVGRESTSRYKLDIDNIATSDRKEPNIELSLKRARGVQDTGRCAQEDRYVLRHSVQSAFSRLWKMDNYATFYLLCSSCNLLHSHNTYLYLQFYLFSLCYAGITHLQMFSKLLMESPVAVQYLTIVLKLPKESLLVIYKYIHPIKLCIKVQTVLAITSIWALPQINSLKINLKQPLQLMGYALLLSEL